MPDIIVSYSPFRTRAITSSRILNFNTISHLKCDLDNCAACTLQFVNDQRNYNNITGQYAEEIATLIDMLLDDPNLPDAVRRQIMIFLNRAGTLITDPRILQTQTDGNNGDVFIKFKGFQEYIKDIENAGRYTQDELFKMWAKDTQAQIFFEMANSNAIIDGAKKRYEELVAGPLMQILKDKDGIAEAVDITSRMLVETDNLTYLTMFYRINEPIMLNYEVSEVFPKEVLSYYKKIGFDAKLNGNTLELTYTPKGN